MMRSKHLWTYGPILVMSNTSRLRMLLRVGDLISLYNLMLLKIKAKVRWLRKRKKRIGFSSSLKGLKLVFQFGNSLWPSLGIGMHLLKP